MEKLIPICQMKANLNIRSMYIKAILAGIFIALGGLGSQMMNAATETTYMGAFIFPVGLILVVCTGSELFTGNCLMTAAFADRKIPFIKMLLAWINVYIGNFIGSMIIAYMVSACNMQLALNGKLGVLMIKTAKAKTAILPPEAFSKGILCNILVCVAVYIAIQANTIIEKILAVYFPIMLFVLCGFEHSVANMYFLTLELDPLKVSGITIPDLMNNIVPVTLGNIVGGAGFALLMYFGSVKDNK